jgi:glycerol-3-phosphate dehydrogenase
VTRDLKRLADTRFDLLVVGAGIYGTTCAWDAAQRGLSVVVIDRGDFGGQTTFNSAKTVHGGVRSLQSGNIAELRQFVRERRALCRILPHLIHPLPFVIPTLRDLRRNRFLLATYFALNDLLTRDRNDDLSDPSKHLPPSRLLSRDECLQLHPAAVVNQVTGGILWFDYQMYNSDRVNLSFLLSASQAGAAMANYVEARRLLRSGDRVEGVEAYDRLADQRLQIRARVVLNAAGPWAPAFVSALASASRMPAIRLSKAMNLVTGPIVRTHAAGGLAGSRFLFMAPWRDYSIVGTSHDPFEGDPGSLRVTVADVERFLAEVRQGFPGIRIDISDVRLVHRGLLPAEPSRPGTVRLLKRSQLVDHRAEGLDGLISIVGVRYTTARETAEQAIDLVFRLLGQSPPPCRTAVTPLAGGDIERVDQFLGEQSAARLDGMSRKDLERLVFSYGTGARQLLESMRITPGDRVPLGATCPVTAAEIRHAVQSEMALKLSDAVLRRTEAGSAGHPGRDALAQAARIMAAELRWTEERMAKEISEVEETYRIDN